MIPLCALRSIRLHLVTPSQTSPCVRSVWQSESSLPTAGATASLLLIPASQSHLHTSFDANICKVYSSTSLGFICTSDRAAREFGMCDTYRKKMFPCYTFRGMNWGKRGGEKDAFGSIHGNLTARLITRLVLQLSISYLSVKYRNNQAYTSQIWCYSNMNFLSQNVFLPTDIFHESPSARCEKGSGELLVRPLWKNITSNHLAPPSTNPAALYEANEFFHQHIECYIAWWMLMAATSL